MKLKHLFVATLTGLLLALVFPSLIAYASATVCQIANGCTGNGSTPSYGQLLVGNGSGGYTLTATSSLGIAGGGSSASTTLLSDKNTWTGLNTFGSATTTGSTYLSSASYPNVQIGTPTTTPGFEMQLNNTGYGNYGTLGIVNGAYSGGLVLDTNASDNFNGHNNYLWIGNKTNNPLVFGTNNNNNCGLYDDNTYDTLFDCFPPTADWGTANQESTYTGSLVLPNNITDWTDYTNQYYGGTWPTGYESSINISSTATTSLASQAETFEMKFWFPGIWGYQSNASSTTPFLVASSSIGAIAVGWPTVQSSETINQRGGDFGLQPDGGVFQVIGSSTDNTTMTVYQGSTTQATSIAFRIRNNYVGIDNGNPQTNLDVSGAAHFTSNIFMDQSNGGYWLNALNTFNNGLWLNPTGGLEIRTAGIGAINVSTSTQNVGISTSTPGSVFAIGSVANFTSATSTFYGKGINLTGGCFAINGSCLTSSGASSTLLANNNTFSGIDVFSNLLNLSATTSSLLATDASGNVIATTSIGATLITGTLPVSHGGTGVTGSTGTGNVVLSNGPTFTSNVLMPSVFGGGGAGNSITIKSTSGAGTTDAIIFQVGNNGATEGGRFIDNGNLGLGTTTPWGRLSVMYPVAGSQNPLFVVASSTLVSTSTAFIVTASNNVGVGTSTPQGLLSLVPPSDQKVLTITAASGQASNLIEIDSNTGALLSRFNSAGALVLSTTNSPNELVNPSAASAIGLQVKGMSGQTGDLQQWLNSGATVLDTVNSSGFLGVGTSTPDATVSDWGSIALNVNDQSGNYTVATSTDFLIAITSTGSTRTVTLPFCSATSTGSVTDKLQYEIKDESGGAATNNITVTPVASQKIDGATNKAINTNYGFVHVYCDGQNSGGAWFTM